MSQPPPCILIGASTGGVEALHCLLGSLPAECPPIFVVQHMRPGFVASFVEGLARACRLRVLVAADRQSAVPGMVLVAPDGDRHLTVDPRAGLTCRLERGPPVNGHCPSVDALFQSGLRLATPPVAVILTGMGRDGAAGICALHAAGSTTIAQNRATSVVWGMPRAATESGGVTHSLPIDQIGPMLSRLVRPIGSTAPC